LEKFRIKNRLWISILLILSICMMSIHVYGGEKREWAKVSDWTEVIVAGDSESDQVKVGAEGKLRIQCWETEESPDYDEMQTAPYQLKVSLITGDRNYNQTFTVNTSERADRAYYKEFNFTDLPEGTYEITVIPEADVCICFRSYTYETVFVEPTYKELSRLAKSLATKNIVYKNIDVGEHARLYGKTISSDAKFSYETMYILGGSCQPYIDIKKKGKTATLRLAVRGRVALVSPIGYYNLNLEKIRFYTSNRRVTMELGDETEWSRYNYKNGMYSSCSDWWVTLSSNSKDREEQLNKIIKIFEQKKVRVRVYGDDGASVVLKLTESQRKNWLGVFKKYKKLLKEYWYE
jgi:hypothetical protein